MTKSKRLPKIQKGYSNRSGQFRHDNADLVFEKRFEVKRVKRVLKEKKYTETDKFLKLKDEYLRNDDEYVKQRKMNKNSAVTWFNAIDGILPVPKTILVEYNHYQFISAMEGNPEVDKGAIEKTIKEIEVACNEIGWPCFIRSDLTSAKHSGPSHYLARDKGELEKVLFRTAEDNELKLWPFASPTHFMIREFLNLSYDFTAFSGLPIAREFRLFADKDNVFCIHPYWPEQTLKFKKAPDGWREQLKKHHEIPEEIEEIKFMAMKACWAIDASIWSVDFAQDVNGKWWLIDMAHAEDSYHWEGCEKVFKEEKK